MCALVSAALARYHARRHSVRVEQLAQPEVAKLRRMPLVVRCARVCCGVMCSGRCGKGARRWKVICLFETLMQRRWRSKRILALDRVGA